MAADLHRRRPGRRRSASAIASITGCSRRDRRRPGGELDLTARRGSPRSGRRRRRRAARDAAPARGGCLGRWQRSEGDAAVRAPGPRRWRCRRPVRPRRSRADERRAAAGRAPRSAASTASARCSLSRRLPDFGALRVGVAADLEAPRRGSRQRLGDRRRSPARSPAAISAEPASNWIGAARPGSRRSPQRRPASGDRRRRRRSVTSTGAGLGHRAERELDAAVAARPASVALSAIGSSAP